MTPDAALSRFPIGTIDSITRLGNGRIHETFHVHASTGEFVLQKVGPLFAPTLPDIDSVTTHLSSKGLLTSRVVRSEEKLLSVADGQDAWRLMTFIAGTTVENEPSETQVCNGAAFIARFHEALADYTKPFGYHIPHYRDTTYALDHLQDLERANVESPKYEKCHPLAEEIERRRSLLSPAISSLPLRTLHGDLKLNNLRFDEHGTSAIALLDLDTLGTYPLPLELGDMLRSWCKHDTEIDVEKWTVIMRTYREHAAFMQDDEWRLIPDGFFEITLSLASRYCADAYEESWFKQDAAYGTLFEQNIERTQQCLNLVDSFHKVETVVRALHQ